MMRATKMRTASLFLVGLLCGCQGDNGNGPTTGSLVSGVKFVPPVGRIELSSVGFDLSIGKTATLVPTLYTVDGLVLTDRTVSWRSSAPIIATVSANGTITGVAIGKTTITAESGGKTADAVISVTF